MGRKNCIYIKVNLVVFITKKLCKFYRFNFFRPTLSHYTSLEYYWSSLFSVIGIYGGWLVYLLICVWLFIWSICTIIDVISKRSTILRLISMSMVKPVSIFIIFVLIQYICFWPFTFCNMISPSSLFRPRLLRLII